MTKRVAVFKNGDRLSTSLKILPVLLWVIVAGAVHGKPEEDPEFSQPLSAEVFQQGYRSLRGRGTLLGVAAGTTASVTLFTLFHILGGGDFAWSDSEVVAIITAGGGALSTAPAEYIRAQLRNPRILRRLTPARVAALSTALVGAGVGVCKILLGAYSR